VPIKTKNATNKRQSADEKTLNKILGEEQSEESLASEIAQ